MPDYKRKHRSRFKAAPKIDKKRVKRNDFSKDIEMSSFDNKPKKQKMRVVKGKKLEQKRKFKFFVYALSIVLVIFFVFQLIMPAGLVETLSNAIAVLGAGKYPLELSSGNTVNVVSKGSYYFVLSDTEINAVSNSGKHIFSYSHGFENPVIKTSSTRALVFDQGGTTALIFDLGGLKSSVSSKNDIINAAIGDNGSYALVTSADNYAAAVNVYKKNNELIYEWFSSEDMINNVAISGNGKKIAVSTMSSGVGGYNSKVSILNFKSANAEYTKDFPNTIVYELNSATGRGFSIVTENSYSFVSFSGKQITEYKNEYSADMFRVSSAGAAIVFNRDSDKTDNRIVIFAKNGKIKAETQFKGIINDVLYYGGNIYCLSDTTVCILDTEGKNLRNASAGFGVKRISVIGQNKVVTITDNMISEIKLKQE